MLNLGRDEVQKLLDFDPLAAAEVMTGKSYKDDDDTGWLGFTLLRGNSTLKDDALSKRGDTTFTMSADAYRAAVLSFGFHKVLHVPFTGRRGEQEDYYVYWRSDGLLLEWDTYCWDDGDKTRNSATVHFDWSVNDWHNADDRSAVSRARCSGGYHRIGDSYVWSGYFDAREALGFNLETLKTHGCFLTPWLVEAKDRMSVWLTHYNDNDDSDNTKTLDERIANSYAVTRERVAMMPEEVQSAIAVGIR